MINSQPTFSGFIVGEGRSGTTLFSAMLNRHSKVCVTPETHFYRHIGVYPNGPDGFVANYPKSLREIFSDMSGTSGWVPDPEPIIKKYPTIHTTKDISLLFLELGNEIATKFDKNMWLEKTPSHIRNIALIDQLHPNQKVIYIARDGRAVAESLSRMDWASNNYIENCLRWAWTMHLYQRFLKRRKNTLAIRYEDLVTNTEGTLKRVCAFLEIAYEQKMLQQSDQDKNLIETGQQHKNKVMGEIDPGNIERWRNKLSSKTVGNAERLIGYEIIRWGYRLDTTRDRDRIYRKLFLSPFPPSANTHKYECDIITDLITRKPDLLGSSMLNIGEQVVNAPDCWVQFEEIMSHRFCEQEGESSTYYFFRAVINLTQILFSKQKRLVLYYHPDIYDHCLWLKKRLLVKYAIHVAWKVVVPAGYDDSLEHYLGGSKKDKIYLVQ